MLLPDVISGLLVSFISGIIGFLIKKIFFSEETYLSIKTKSTSNNYPFISGKWYLYHYTHDPKISKDLALGKSRWDLTIKNTIVNGRETIEASHRRSITYYLRGQINSGILYVTGVNVEDNSDAFSIIFNNLLDDVIYGLIIAIDYNKKLYSSPAFISRNQVTDSEAKKILKCIDAQHYQCVSLSD